ncbi:MAG: GNAT family N-acetyltransferase [Actinomycetota bacterium]|nr:GNAT family N-acetyltransferase [Actinomycetota bacterium]
MQFDVPQLTDGFVRLRLLTQADATPYARAFSEDPDLGRLLGFDTDPTLAELGVSLGGVAERAHSGQAVEFAIVGIADARFLGLVLLFGVSDRHRRCEVGFWIVPDARRAGFGRRAVALAIDWVFGELALERVELTTTPENPVIPAFARSLGFSYEGRLRRRNRERGQRIDILWFGLLDREWVRPGAA